MHTESRRRRVLALSSVAGIGVALAVVFWAVQPFDAYLLERWTRELPSLPDDEVPVRLEQIAALGERSIPALVDALHSQRQIVAETAASLLQRKLGELQLRSTDESSSIVAHLACELADRGASPGPYSGRESTRLATRLLLWPIDRQLIDGQQLVADCESIIRSAKRAPTGQGTEPPDEELANTSKPVSEDDGSRVAEPPMGVAGGDLPVQLTDSPSLPPQVTHVPSESPPSAPTTEPPDFVPYQPARDIESRPIAAVRDDGMQPMSAADDDAPGQRAPLHPETARVPRSATDRQDLDAMPDLDVMRLLAGDDESLAREAVDELYRRGFQTKHFRLAELLVDPDPNVRLQLVRSLPGMSGIDSRPWLVWLSHDLDAEVRRAAVAVIATSTDPMLQRRVVELEREETDDSVLEFVREILSSRAARTIR